MQKHTKSCWNQLGYNCFSLQVWEGVVFSDALHETQTQSRGRAYLIKLPPLRLNNHNKILIW